MPESSLPVVVSEYLVRHRTEGARVVPLTGDASDRRYFRVLLPSGPSFVLAVHAAPFDAATLPFLNVARLLAAMPVPIPTIIGVAEDLGVLALEDLGDVTLQAHLGAASPAERDQLYREAAGLVRVLQRRGADLADPRFIPFKVAFDVEKLTWEMDFFIKHFIEAYRGVHLTPAARDELRGELGLIVAELAAEPRVLCHRDYHSRNLMTHAGRLYVIDFQDARLGPDTYDLVSLLRDSYVDLPQGLVDAIIREFAAEAGGRPDLVTFRRRFDLMALQRNLKALGTFGYQAATRANPVYIQYIPRTLRYARGTLAAYDRFARLRACLGDIIDELRPDAPAVTAG